MPFDLLSLLGLKQAADIQLPNQSGRVDPRLAQPDVGAALKQALQGYQQLRGVTESLKPRK